MTIVCEFGHAQNLNQWYNAIEKKTLGDIKEYHFRFERIHPFQDGNGRVGRLIMFRECLSNHLIPFIFDNDHKQFYYRGLKEFENVRGYLMDTGLSAQGVYKEWVKIFYGEGKNLNCPQIIGRKNQD